MAVDKESADHPITRSLLAWYDLNARELPWRVPPGASGMADPYHVWLSEIMLQQTTVATVSPYFSRFLSLWPTVHDLAAADDADVMRAWAGLGYYARARNLLAAARMVAGRGAFPESEAGLRELPGVGPYTAAAIAAIAFDQPAVVIDGNIERVTSRLFALPVALPAGRPTLAEALARLVPARRPGDFAQALMDLGATICTARKPRCLLCPLADPCLARAAGTPEAYPVKAPRKSRPLKQGIVWWIEHAGQVALVRRPPKGLLGGMLALPGSEWAARPAQKMPFIGDWRVLNETVRHGFTHFDLDLTLAMIELDTPASSIDGHQLIWTRRSDVATAGLPTVFARAASMALAHFSLSEGA